jgi:hypothetical protein
MNVSKNFNLAGIKKTQFSVLEVDTMTTVPSCQRPAFKLFFMPTYKNCA